MLVLSRKRYESIVINGNIVVSVVEIRGDKVRIGIEAPKEVVVDRNEVAEAKMRNSSGIVSTKSSLVVDTTERNAG